MAQFVKRKPFHPIMLVPVLIGLLNDPIENLTGVSATKM